MKSRAPSTLAIALRRSFAATVTSPGTRMPSSRPSSMTVGINLKSSGGSAEQGATGAMTPVPAHACPVRLQQYDQRELATDAPDRIGKDIRNCLIGLERRIVLAYRVGERVGAARHRRCRPRGPNSPRPNLGGLVRHVPARDRRLCKFREVEFRCSRLIPKVAVDRHVNCLLARARIEMGCSHWHAISTRRHVYIYPCTVTSVNGRSAPMTLPLPSGSDVIIIGGGIVGCSIAYHLAKLGITDVLLLEAQAAHLRHDLARGRADRAAARDAADDRTREVHLRAARTHWRRRPDRRPGSSRTARSASPSTTSGSRS